MARRKRARKNKEEKREKGASLSPLPHPLVVCLFVCLFFAPISLRCPHDLNAWNKLGKEKIANVAKTKNSTGIARKNY